MCNCLKPLYFTNLLVGSSDPQTIKADDNIVIYDVPALTISIDWIMGLSMLVTNPSGPIM